MKPYLLSFLLGCAVGVLYGLCRIKIRLRLSLLSWVFSAWCWEKVAIRSPNSGFTNRAKEKCYVEGNRIRQTC